MLLTLATLAGLALAQDTDTSFAVRPGTRLDVNNYGGEIVVHGGGSDNRVRIRASHTGRDRVSISVTGSQINVRSEGRHGPAQMVDYDITVPKWMAVNLSGIYTDITIDGTESTVAAETVEGDVELTGGSGTVTLKSVEGTITITGSRGNLDANSVEGEIRITGATGDIVAETVDGDIILEQIESASIETNTVDGDITYDGTIKDGGRYHFETHDGDLTIGIPERSNATVFVSTFEGEFDACFPVNLTDTRKHRFQFTIGSGSARLELESFDGDIKLCGPGQSSRESHRTKNHDNDH